MLAVEAAPLLWVEAQIAAGACAVLATCRGAIEGAAEAGSGAPPGYYSGASSAANALRLSKQLASEAQLAELLAGGTPIAGAGTGKAIRDVERLVGTYGGEAGDWAKIRSSSFSTGDGVRFESHAHRNITTGQTVEPKVKFQ